MKQPFNISRLVYNFSIFVIFIVAAADLTSQAQAQNLTIMPVNINMAPGQKAATLSLTNPTPNGFSFQVRGFQWARTSSGQDELTPTDLLLVSPPLGTIQPGDSQTIRIILRKAATDREEMYRVLIDQIPVAGAPKTVSVTFRVSIPIFVPPSTPAEAETSWAIESAPDGLYLAATNNGGKHDKVLAMTIQGGRGSSTIALQPTPYIFPHSTQRWKIPASVGAAGPHFKISGQTIGGSVDQDIKTPAP